MSAVSNRATTVAHDANKGGGTNTQPLYSTNIQNGLSSILFDGTTDYLTVNPIAQLQSLAGATLIVVAKLVNTSATQIITTAGTNNANIDGFNLGTASNKFVVKMAQGVATSDYTTDTACHIHTIVFDGSLAAASRILYRIDGVQRAYTLSVNPNTATGATINQLYIGADATSSNYYHGYLGEILIYTKALSTAEILSAEANLKSKWGIA